MNTGDKEKYKREKEAFEEKFFDTKTGKKFQKEFNIALGIGCVALGLICISIVTGFFFKIDECTSEIIDSIIDIVFLVMMLWAGYFVGYFNGAFNQSRDVKIATKEIKKASPVEVKKTVAPAPRKRATSTTKKSATTTRKRTTKKSTETK